MVGSRYRIEAEAGEGGMGKVYRAIDLDLHRTVALKVVRPDLASSPATLNQLKHEISIASQISHRNVLRVHDLGEASGLRYISMAWAEGENLGNLLKRAAPLPENQIVDLASEICEGLEAAHEQGVSHRDLKPSNILLTADGHACIADFGLAHSLHPTAAPSGSSAEGSHGESSSGTPRYMSPEQVDGVRIDHRTDIYSLGLILYEMATGGIPFNDDSALQTMAQRLTEKAASPKLANPALSDKLTGIILHCLEQDPNRRYASVRELLSELQEKPKQLDAPAVQIRAGTRRGWLVGAVAAAVVLAVAGWLWRQRAPKAVIPPHGKYIAVLPFRSIGWDPSLRYRAEGIADAISARLATLNSLHPISASALEKVSLSQPEEAIGKQLGANLLVRGTVQSEGDRIKVDSQIYDIAKRATVWSKSYERVVGDLFTLEDEISNDTENALDVKPTIEERERAEPAPTQNLAAYDLYLKGRDILKKHRDAGNAKAALALFEQALKKDDAFALAWTGVADASLLLYRITNDSLYASHALAAAQEARARNNNLPEVHFALGSVYTATGRNAEAVSEIKQALQLSPNSDDGYIRLGRAYRATGQAEESIAALKKAVELNPYYWFNHNQLGSGYYHLGRNEDARREFQEQVAENPQNEDGYNNVAATFLQQAEWKKAIPELEKAIQIAPTTLEFSNLATAHYQLGKYREAIPIYRQALILNPNDTEVLRNLAEAYAHDGQREKADETYDRAISLLYNDQLAVNPRNAQAIGTLAMCFAGKGNTAKARQLILQARSIDSADSGLMYDEAFIEAKDGHIPEALTALQNALENGYSFEYCLSDPDLKALRDSQGFKALKKRFGHPSEERRR
jgi:serine/threonine-protein kinase